MPTHASNVQKPRSCVHPENEILPLFKSEGATRNCSDLQSNLEITISISMMI